MKLIVQALTIATTFILTANFSVAKSNTDKTERLPEAEIAIDLIENPNQSASVQKINELLKYFNTQYSAGRKQRKGYEKDSFIKMQTELLTDLRSTGAVNQHPDLTVETQNEDTQERSQVLISLITDEQSHFVGVVFERADGKHPDQLKIISLTSMLKEKGGRTVAQKGKIPMLNLSFSHKETAGDRSSITVTYINEVNLLKESVYKSLKLILRFANWTSRTSPQLYDTQDSIPVKKLCALFVARLSKFDFGVKSLTATSSANCVF